MTDIAQRNPPENPVQAACDDLKVVGAEGVELADHLACAVQPLHPFGGITMRRATPTR